MTDDSRRRELVAKTRDVLASFDSGLASVASAVARDEYVFWLGSGLSASVRSSANCIGIGTKIP